MNTELEMVREFQVKHGSPTEVMLTGEHNKMFKAISTALFYSAQQLERALSGSDDPRILRVQLMCEELAETIDAMNRSDELLLLDGLADLLYVTLGTAVTFDMPVISAYHEVHASNMTKEPIFEGSQLKRARLRVKGSKFKQPNLEKILNDYRIDKI